MIRTMLCICLCASTSFAAQPNLLFILTEDNSSQLSFNGTPGIQTPNLDALAKSGVYFNNEIGRAQV